MKGNQQKLLTEGKKYIIGCDFGKGKDFSVVRKLGKPVEELVMVPSNMTEQLVNLIKRNEIVFPTNQGGFGPSLLSRFKWEV